MVKVSTDAVTNVDDDEGEVAPAPTLPVGFVVSGKYKIKSVLGAGGNGAVYEGEHVAVGHRVAIKVVHPTLANRRDIIARFQREARICGTLQHPHVGQVYDVGTLDDGAPYMVMELHVGRSFADVIDETRIPIPATLHIVRQLLDGLGAAHQAGAIHRDVKPDNVMIVRDRSGEIVVKLVDFGISKTLGDRGNHSVTGEGLIIGSPDYMSPEQLRGEDVDARSDIYSTGVLLYEAITGRRPFEHAKLVDLVAAVMRDPVTPPGQLRRECPSQLEAIVLKAMSRDPAQRFASADDMARAIEGVQALSRGSPAVSLAQFNDRPLAAPVSGRSTKRWYGWPVAGVAGVALAGLIAVFALRSGASRPARDPALVPAPPPKSIEASPSAAASALPSTAPSAPAQPDRVVIEPVVIDMPSQPDTTRPAPAAIVRQRVPERRAQRTEPAPSEPAPAPQDVEPLLKEASKAFALGQVERARELYSEVVRAVPARAEAWRGLGLASNRLGQRAEAERAFARYLSLRPNAPDAARIREQLESAP